MKADSGDQYNSLAIILGLAIIIALIFNLYMSGLINRDQKFSELYFIDHWDIPGDMRENRTYNVTFTVINHEDRETTYVYEVLSEPLNATNELTLGVGESGLITLQVTPLEKTWNITWYVDSTREDIMNTSDNENITTTYEIPSYGEVFHQRTTIAELMKKPLRNYNEISQLIGNNTRQTRINQTMTTDGKNIILQTSEKSVERTIAKKPFTIRVLGKTQEGTPLEIHYWYEVR
jgi:hypothetical protein